jgi:uncharacterized protein
MATTTPNPTGVTDDVVATGAIDCDVHNLFRDGLRDLAPYLDDAWRKKFRIDEKIGWADGLPGMEFKIPTVNYVVPGGTMRIDATPPDGGPPASDPQYMVKDLIERYQMGGVILTGGNILSIGGMPEPEAAAAIASAYNEWLADVWLSADPRYRGSILVGPRDPALAVEEIRKWGNHPRMCQVFVPDFDGAVIGRRHYWPILEAAEHYGLPVALHSGGQASGHNTTMMPSAPSYFSEFHVLLPQLPQAGLTSLVFEGCFERFPKLQVVLIEAGFSWLVNSLWRMDKDWKALRHEVPWVKHEPSEYVRQHVRVSTQPIDEPADPRHMEMMLELMHGDELLMFSTDYPHWDADDPVEAMKSFPPDIRRKIMYDNPREFYPRVETL